MFTNKYILMLSLASLTLGAVSCSSSDEPDDPSKENATTVTLSLADKQATAETKALYSNLWNIGQTGFMFGHHDDLMYGRKWYNEQGRSDTKDVCGDYPAVYSLDFAELSDNRYTESEEATAIRRRCILEARQRGMVMVASVHWNNPLTGGDAWDNSSNQVAKEILTSGSEANKTFTSWLDRLSDFVLALKDDQGQPIPIVFRPFH